MVNTKNDSKPMRRHGGGLSQQRGISPVHRTSCRPRFIDCLGFPLPVPLSKLASSECSTDRGGDYSPPTLLLWPEGRVGFNRFIPYGNEGLPSFNLSDQGTPHSLPSVGSSHDVLVYRSTGAASLPKQVPAIASFNLHTERPIVSRFGQCYKSIEFLSMISLN